MQQQNTVRKNDEGPAGGGLYLAYSRSWTPERQARAAAQLIQRRDQLARRGRRTPAKTDKSVSKLKRSLTAATLCAPLLWAGRALLRWKHTL
jgi:hypothetical protein